jgi:hypothetical protein
MVVKFTVVRDDDVGRILVSQKFNYGNFDCYYVIQERAWEALVGEREQKEIGSKWLVDLSVVSPSEAGQDNINTAMDGYPEDAKNDIMAQVEALVEYGVAASMLSKSGNNLRNLVREAKEIVRNMQILFGFYMDRQVNAIGSTGWDFVKGDITAGVRRWQEAKDAKAIANT